jgi:hypothetical protein
MMFTTNAGLSNEEKVESLPETLQVEKRVLPFLTEKLSSKRFHVRHQKLLLTWIMDKGGAHWVNFRCDPKRMPEGALPWTVYSNCLSV